MTAARSLRCFGSSAACTGTTVHIMMTSKREAFRFIASSSDQLRELVAVGKNGPDRLARRVDRLGERRVAVLQEGQGLHEQELVRLPQLGERGLEPPLVIVAELLEQVIDLVLERQLRQHA